MLASSAVRILPSWARPAHEPKPPRHASAPATAASVPASTNVPVLRGANGDGQDDATQRARGYIVPKGAFARLTLGQLADGDEAQQTYLKFLAGDGAWHGKTFEPQDDEQRKLHAAIEMGTARRESRLQAPLGGAIMSPLLTMWSSVTT